MKKQKSEFEEKHQKPIATKLYVNLQNNRKRFSNIFGRQHSSKTGICHQLFQYEIR